MTGQYEAIIGLEIHVQLATQSKMFCSCSNTGEGQPMNTTVCPVCMGHPGTLPVPNREAIRLGVLLARALHCRIPEHAKFDRKSYFYPDLPKGYQISQYDKPIAVGGHLDVRVGEHVHRVGITRLHLEEDAAKLLHGRSGASVVDFNRAGSPLAEIVSEPDLRSPEEAGAFLRELRRIVRYLDVSDGDMEKGHLRCDANISLRPRGEVRFSPKTEIKNLNSFRAVERALAYEVQRQTALWNAAAPPDAPSTHGWDDANGSTVLQRTKEDAAEYRYFPEPDIPPLTFTNEYLRAIDASMPELPEERRQRFADEYRLPTRDIEVLVNDKALSEYFEAVISELKAWVKADGRTWEAERPQLLTACANWIINRFTKLLADRKELVQQSKITPENFAEFVKIAVTGRVNNRAAQKILETMAATGGDPSHIIEEQGLEQIEDEELLNQLVRKVLDANPKVIEDVKAGKQQATMFLVGQVMREAGGKANPQVVRALLDQKLTS